MSSFPYIFRKHPSEQGIDNSRSMSKSYIKKLNSSTRRDSLTSNCSRVSNTSSLWSSASSGISSLDVSLMTGHTMTEEMKTDSKYVVSDDGIRSQSEVNIMVGKDIINLKDLSAPQVRGRGLISSEIMSCVANHTKLLEGVTRELRLELTAYQQQLTSRKNYSRKQNRAIRQDAIIIENVGSSCADTLKHIKNLYDQTRYLKGVINMIEDEFDLDIRANFSGRQRKKSSQNFTKLNGYLLGCITMILVGFSSKLIYKDINLSGILNDLSYYANVWMLTLSKYFEQPSVIQSRTVLLEVT